MYIHIIGFACLAAALIFGCSGDRTPAQAPPAKEQPPAGSAPAPAPAPATETAEDDALVIEDGEDEGIHEVPGCLDLTGPEPCRGIGKVLLGCTAFGNVLAPEPAARVVACLQRKSGTAEICDTKVLETCGLAAIDAHPPAAQHSGTCRSVFGACTIPDEYARLFTEDRCARGLSALQARPSADFSECMLRKCDLLLCFSGLL